jgi:NAD(P)H-dependent flavin oxidoreductase YrpB (nitropropane dioxygenase family)
MVQSVRTALCGELGIEHPIFLAGMGTAAGPEIVTAVSEAGGFGVLGASAFPPTMIRELISGIRRRTARPFGVNIIIDERDLSTEEDKAELREQVSAAIAEGVAAVVLFWGDPAPYVEEAHRHGVRLFVQVGSVDEAKAAASAGVDAVIAQGVEAGGHVRGQTSIWTLLPAVVESIAPLPVLASGGIGDGEGVARAIRMGAQGVSLGTRFIASDEAWCHPAYKQRVVESTASDTVYSELFDIWWPDAPHRTLRNKTVSEWEAAGRPPTGSRPGEGTSIGRRRMGSGAIGEWPRYAIGVATPDFDGDIDYAPLWAGESCSVVNDIKPAAQIVRDLVAEAQIALPGAPAPR